MPSICTLAWALGKMTQFILKLVDGTELVLTPGDPCVVVGGRRVVLRPRELALLELLARKPGCLIKTAVLAKQLAAHGRESLSKVAVAVHVHRLRIRLKPVGLTIRCFRDIAGYALTHQPRA